MSKIIAEAAIRGAYACMKRAESMLSEAIDRYGRSKTIAFPDTAYALPVILALVGKRVEHLAPGTAHGKAMAPLSWRDARRRSGHLGGT
jgi:hypothetical protein